MKYYAAENSYGSSTSHGFANTWDVYVFSSKKARDNWVSAQNTLTAKKITRSEATKTATNWSLTRNETNAPKPFTGEYWGIEDYSLTDSDENAGMLGQLVRCGSDECCDRFYS